MDDAMSLRNVARGWGDLLRRAGRNVLPLFVGFAAVEVVALTAVTIAVPQDASVGDLVKLLDGRYPVWLPVAVILLVLMNVVQTTLPAAIRPVVVDERPMTIGESLGACLARLPSMVFLFFVTTFIISAALAVLFAAGAQVMVISLMLIQFALKPAEWLVAGRDRPVLNAISQAWRWSRRQGIWVLGVQSAIGLVTAAVVNGLELDPMVPMSIAAFVTGHMAVRFVQWSGLNGLFIALDRAEFGQ
jgi:hypothetical protein